MIIDEVSAWKKTKTFTIDSAHSTADAIETGYDAVIDGVGIARNSTDDFLDSDAAHSTVEAIKTGYDTISDGAGTAWNSTIDFLQNTWDANTKPNDSVGKNREIEDGTDSSKTLEHSISFDTVGKDAGKIRGT